MKNMSDMKKKCDRKCKVLPEEVEKLLKFDDDELAVVFAIDRRGNVQAYRNRKSGEARETPFPLKADKITSMQCVTVFETANPKTCWTDGSGNLVCVEW